MPAAARGLVPTAPGAAARTPSRPRRTRGRGLVPTAPGAAARTPSRPRRTRGRALEGERPAVSGPSPTGWAARGRTAEGHRTSDRGRGGTYAQAIEYARARPWRRGVASTARSAASRSTTSGTGRGRPRAMFTWARRPAPRRSEEHTSELQSRGHLVCRLLL